MSRKGRRHGDASPDLAPTDPRRAGGDYAGPGGPHERNAVAVDITNAVLLDGTAGLVVHLQRNEDGSEEDAFGIMLEGRINKTDERSKVLHLTDLQGLAYIAAECVSLAGRAGVPMTVFMELFEAQMEAQADAQADARGDE